MGTHFNKASDMRQLALLTLLSLALAVATVVATPVERTNGVTSKNYELESYNHFIPVNRGSLLVHPHAYHLINIDERRGLVKRSPLVNIISNAPDQDVGSIVDGSRHLTKRSALPPFIPGIIKPKKLPKKVPLKFPVKFPIKIPGKKKKAKKVPIIGKFGI